MIQFGLSKLFLKKSKVLGGALNAINAINGVKGAAQDN